MVSTARFFRMFPLAMFAVAPALACSSSTSPPAQAFVSASLQGSASTCVGFPTQTTVLQIGGDDGARISRIADGASDSGQPVHVTCTVVSRNGAFDVQLSASKGAGSTGASMTVIASGLSPTAGGPASSAGFVTIGNAYTSDSCTISYTYQGAPVNASPVVTDGRIWAHIECPAATNPVLTVAGGAPSTCLAKADFIFENCGH